MQITKFDFKFLSSIFLFNIGLKLFRLNIPNYAYFDERAYYIPAARDYLQGVFTTNFEQPYLGKLFMAGSIYIFGDNPWGWRIPEVIVGSLGVVFIYLLAKAMFPPSLARRRTSEGEWSLVSLGVEIKERFVPILASVFLTFEFSWFLFSRVGTLEIYVATFSLAAAFFFWRFLQTEKNLPLVLTGVFFGLAISSKWSGLFLLVFVGVYYLWFRRKEFFQALLKMVLVGLMAFGVYISTYVFYLQSHSLAELFELHAAMINFHVEEHSQIVEEKSGIVVNQLGYLYSPLAWVFNYTTLYLGETTGYYAKVIGQFYNPALLWGSLATLIISLKRLGKDKEKTFLVGAFLVFWLPWIFIPRISYPYYLLSALPFGIILLSRLIEENFERRKFFLVGFVILASLLFLFYYAIISALPIPAWYLRLLTGGSV